MEQSILKSTKKVLHIGPDDPSFDLDIMTHVNNAFSDLHDLGVGPVDGFYIDDAETEWTAFLANDAIVLNRVKTFVLLKVRLIFDPPSTTFHLAAHEKQLEEVTWRLSVAREGTAWVDPDPPAPVYDENGILIVPGGETVGFDGGGA